MKRTLCEVLAGLVVLVIMASFHHQIARLKSQQQNVTELRGLVENAVTSASSKQEVAQVRREISGLVDERLQKFEQRLAEATEKVDQAVFLKEKLEAARHEADLLKAEVESDVSRTRALVSSYQDEMRAERENALRDITRNRTALERLSGELLPDKDALTRDLLSPTVQLNGDDTVGSGTLISSHLNDKTGQVESFVITSWHVVRNILADTPRAKTEGISVTIYREDEEVEVFGDEVGHDETIDIAMLKLRSDEIFENTAAVMPREHGAEVRVWDEVYAIGCPLGNDPIPTRGAISSVENRLNGTNYWMVNAPTYYGNSGGGIFDAKTRSLIGVFSKIYTHGRSNPIVIPHMGLCTPITSIYEWLDKQDLAYTVEDPAAAGEGSPAVLAEPATPAK
jgi:S1-C subfamily serine protease